MARTPLYSRTVRPTPAVADPADGATLALGPDGPSRSSRVAAWLRRHERAAWLLAALALAVLVGWPAWTQKLQPMLSIEQIDAALRDSIAKEPLPSAAAAAYAAAVPSVVRVVGIRVSAAPAAASAPRPDGAATVPDKRAATPKPHDPAPEDQEDDGRSVGTGVVIVDKGLILTNLHVVAGANRILVTFFDGSESEAHVVSLQHENDLAVLQARTIPDDLHAATLRSTGGLSPGDEVIAVGFPFGIGPSASQGVISGLKREFRSPQGQRILTNLIQFDAAANPGNSGGPLVTMDGHVVGIVTAIMNPNAQRTFIGIGFAVPIENAASAIGLPPF